MKKFLLFAIILSTSFTQINAQYWANVENTGMQIFTKQKESEGVTGSAYYEQDFMMGTVIDKDRRVNLLMRYNAVEDVVVLKPDITTGKEYVLPKIKSIKYKIGNYTYFIDELNTEDGKLEAYFARFYQGDKSDFVGQPVADYTPAKAASTAYGEDKQAKLSVDMVYYISVDGAPFKEVRLKEKDLEDLFKGDKMEDYLDDNKIKTEQDVVSLLKYYEQLN
ncbi:hypothetical protein ACNKXS_06500 [Christiangramia marina]|uniref:hypothetical protein n=1 Tax=Christiangramia marina TaxID=409436 RepID=UPI003AA879DA